MKLNLRLDPWPPEYAGALQFETEEAEVPGVVDPAVETADWLPIRPAAQDRQCLVFVDGVRRVEARVLLDQPQGPVYGLFGSFATGAVEVSAGKAHCKDINVGRCLALCAGISHEEQLEIGGVQLNFAPASSPLNAPQEPLRILQNLMRDQEARLSESLAVGGACVIADGPLTYFTAENRQIAGIIKTLHQLYLPPAHLQLLPRLECGERTPMFAISQTRQDRYSWYLRLSKPRLIDHGLAGIVRLETPAGVGLENAKALADMTASRLPQFASSYQRDPRAPQNLLPISALEDELRRRLGDTMLIRRAIEARLAAGVAA